MTAPMDFDALMDTYQKALRGRARRVLDQEDRIPAAVLMPLCNVDGHVHILLTERTDEVRTHQGQVSFPGGAEEEGDPDRLATALRETHEEVGIVPDQVRLLGQFDDNYSVMGFHVSVFVGVVPYPGKLRLNSSEIRDAFYAPIDLFTDDDNEEEDTMEYQGKEYTIYRYRYHGHDIWGMTARIIRDFVQKIVHAPQ